MEAFGELVERNRRAVFRAALAAVGSATEADDVAQEAFITAFQKLNGFRGESSFKTWLLTITWRKAIDRRKSVTRWMHRMVAPAQSGETGEEWDPMDRVAAGGQSQEDDLVTSDLQKRLKPLIASLPEEAARRAAAGRRRGSHLRRDRPDAEDSDRDGEVARVGSAEGAQTEDGCDGIHGCLSSDFEIDRAVREMLDVEPPDGLRGRVPGSKPTRVRRYAPWKPARPPPPPAPPPPRPPAPLPSGGGAPPPPRRPPPPGRAGPRGPRPAGPRSAHGVPRTASSSRPSWTPN